MGNNNMPLREYKAWIGRYGWYLERSGAGDYKLRDEKGKTRVPFIKVTHPGKQEVPPLFVKKTREKLKEAGLK